MSRKPVSYTHLDVYKRQLLCSSALLDTVLSIQVIGYNRNYRIYSVPHRMGQGTTKIVKDAGMEILGAAFKELTDDLKKQFHNS